jgi:hypothetical protein
MFSARTLNDVGSYVRFFHLRSYMQKRSHTVTGKGPTLDLMATCGYKKSAKFARHRADWDDLARPVPIAYLKAIGADLAVVETAAEADLAEFHRVLRLPLIATYAIERMMPTVYGTIRLPPETPEAEALIILTKFSRGTGHECCIRFPGLKAVFVKPTGEVFPILFPPIYRRTAKFLIPAPNDMALGDCSIGR